MKASTITIREATIIKAGTAGSCSDTIEWVVDSELATVKEFFEVAARSDSEEAQRIAHIGKALLGRARARINEVLEHIEWELGRVEIARNPDGEIVGAAFMPVGQGMTAVPWFLIEKAESSAVSSLN